MTKKFTSFILIVSVMMINFSFLSLHKVYAASLTTISDTVTNLTAGAVANHTIQFTTPTGVASSATIILTFDNSTSIPASLDYTDIDLKDDGVDVTLGATPSGATWGVVRTSGTVITFTNGSSAVTAGSVINIEIGTHATTGATGDQQITNGPAGSTVLRISGSFTDTGALTLPIVANGIVAVSAEVLSTLSFTVSDNTIYFGNLRSAGACFAQGTDPGYVTCPTTTETEAFNMTAATNAPTGYTVSVQGATLTSGGNTITALASNTASSPGTEQFGLRANATGGSGTVSAPYAAAGYAYTANATTPVAVATSTVPSATTTFSVRYLANISPVTEAGSYTTSHTYVATGNF
jgi:hypothetical protein